MQAPTTRGDPDAPARTRGGNRVLRPRPRRCLAVSGGDGTVGSFTDTATSEENSISADSWTTESAVRLTPETLNAGNQSTGTVHLEQPDTDVAVAPATAEAELEDGTAFEATTPVTVAGSDYDV